MLVFLGILRTHFVQDISPFPSVYHQATLHYKWLFRRRKLSYFGARLRYFTRGRIIPRFLFCFGWFILSEEYQPHAHTGAGTHAQVVCAWNLTSKTAENFTKIYKQDMDKTRLITMRSRPDYQNRVSNSWDIPDMDNCCKDKCCVDKCHPDGWNLF